MSDQYYKRVNTIQGIANALQTFERVVQANFKEEGDCSFSVNVSFSKGVATYGISVSDIKGNGTFIDCSNKTVDEGLREGVTFLVEKHGPKTSSPE